MNKDIDIIKETEGMSYEDKMLYVFINKPIKFFWYKKAFLKYNVNGIKTFAFNWSWYAFFFTFFYLFYRKIYFISGVLCFLYFLFGSIGGLLGFFINVILAVVSPYLVYNKYIEKKNEIEKNILDENIRVETMLRAGGTNSGMLYLIIACTFFYFFLISMYFIGFTSIITIVK